MQSDAERWNARYASPDSRHSFDPDPVLRECGQALPEGGRALDVACGTAGNALWLSQRGFRCVGLDVSQVALRLARQEALRRDVCLDLVAADARCLPFAPGSFDLVVVTRYLERVLFSQIRTLLAGGGCVYYRTFNQRRRASQPSFNPRYLLEDNELLAAFEGFQVLAGSEDRGDPGESSYILARSPGRRTSR